VEAVRIWVQIYVVSESGTMQLSDVNGHFRMRSPALKRSYCKPLSPLGWCSDLPPEVDSQGAGHQFLGGSLCYHYSTIRHYHGTDYIVRRRAGQEEHCIADLFRLRRPIQERSIHETRKRLCDLLRQLAVDF
jgi:hypothetical protein